MGSLGATGDDHGAPGWMAAEKSAEIGRWGLFVDRQQKCFVRYVGGPFSRCSQSSLIAGACLAVKL